jgi:hypothetical protein
MPDGAEQRGFARTELDAAVQYWLADGGTPRDGWLGNVSAGGILLWTEDELPVGTTLYLRISADELGDAEVEVTATVVRLDPRRRDERFRHGYGCRFDALYSGPHADAG